ncbi:hypothetical protein KMZ68_23890 [Bradyrhizobium sediminis]|uniref:Uncharacterized protein n=1 Tax=Bradyrhizobium sediminis TaxID=2840469 RepID=A0A975RSP6_9BRAD|nr:hypothetical protein [Bradyrhizobium sediminis]QWG17956.1 hypothetical protein KMZ68_23890 [Bradyrhizobium sediminis]
MQAMRRSADSGEPPALDECRSRDARPTDRIRGDEVEQGIVSSRKPNPPKKSVRDLSFLSRYVAQTGLGGIDLLR